MDIKRIVKVVKVTILTGFVAMTGVAMTGCKPTESGYRKAYEQAQQKQAREEAARRELQRGEQLVGNGALQEVDGCKIERLCGDSVWTLHTRFALKDSVSPYSLAVARMKMPANAHSMTEEYGAGRVVKSGGFYYVLMAESDSCEDVTGALRRFKAIYPEYKAINLPGLTVIVR